MTLTRKHSFIVLVVFFCAFRFTLGLSVDVTKMTFRHITVEDGLYHSVVYSIQKDRDGVLWFALHDGVDRFNGYDFDHFSFSSSNTISSLFVDGQKIWAGIEDEIFLYDYTKGAFLPVIKGLKEDFQVDRVRMIRKWTEEKTIIATNVGVVINDQKLDSTYMLAGIKHNVLSVWTSGDTAIWIATGGGLFLYDCVSRNLAEQTPNPQTNEQLHKILVLSHYHISEDQILLGTRKSGVFILDPVNGSLEQLSLPELGNNYCPLRDIEKYQDQYYLLGFSGRGLIILDQTLNYIAEYTHIVDDEHSLSNTGIHDLFVDDEERIWISTSGGGVNLFDPNLKKFQVTRHVKNNSNSLRNNMIYSIVEDDHHRYWYGTRSGISIYNPVNGDFNHIAPSDLNHDVNIENPILSMIKDREGNIWAATFLYGIIIFNSNGKQINKLRSEPGNPKSLSTDRILSLCEDDQGDIWIGGVHGGLTRYRLVEDNYEIFNELAGIRSITIDYKNRILAGNMTGLYYSNPEKDSFRLFSARKNDSIERSIRVFCIHEDRLKRIWIGTEGDGLGLVNIDEGTQMYYTVEDGLPSNSVYGIIEDDEGNLWLSTNQGLSRFDPGRVEFRNYTNADGLSGIMFNSGAYFKALDGTFFFGGTNGLTSFVPSEIETNLKTPHILFTNFYVFDRDKEDYPDNNLLQNINEADEIRLKHYQNSFTIEFTAINYTSTEKNQYRWKMEGLDQFEDRWTDNQNSRTASFLGLSPGKYKFLVQASNNDGIWNYQGKNLSIVVSPPFWNTLAAKLLYALLILAILVALRKHIMLILKEKQSVEKIRFFISLAHDLRTPLTLIKGPVEDIIRVTPEGTEEKNKLELVANNTERLNKLISQLLDFQKADLNKLILKVSKERIDKIITISIKNFEPLAHKSNISILYEGDDEVTGWCDRFKVERILYNLISNALKYSFPGGKIRLILAKSGDHIILQVLDQGRGIPRDQQKNIFTRFYRSENIVNTRIAGSGVGLIVTKKLVDKHKGKLEFTSRENVGTTFRLTIPINQEAYSAEEICPIETERPVTERVRINIPHAGDNDRQILIMVVEDNEELRNYLSGNLKDYYRIATASNGKEALEKVKKMNPDLIVSDIIMSEMDGFEFCTRIRENINTCHIPLILLTALKSLQDKISGLEYGADDYVEKPFDFYLLKTRIDNLIRSRRMLQDKYVNKPNHKVLSEIRNGYDKEMMEKITNVVNENYHDSSFLVEDLCSRVGVSRPVLYRKLKAYTNLSPQDFIKTFRLKRAEEILVSSSKSIKEIAYEVGFSDPRYFSSCFKKYFGASPKQFVKI